jgi:hypothetical protein
MPVVAASTRLAAHRCRSRPRRRLLVHRRQSLRLGIAHALNAGHIADAHDTAGYVTLVIR